VVVAMNLDIWLVRHGATDWTAGRRFCGWSDPPLSERGRWQAKALRPRLDAYRFDSVMSSNSIRAVETARLAYGEPLQDERLRELDFGDIEGQTWAECSPDVRERLLDFDSFEAPNGESVAQLTARVTQVLSELREGRHLIVTHGGVIRVLMGSRGMESYPEPGDLSRVRVTIDEGKLRHAGVA
jgi:probable phosphoglycerate mutase